MIIKQLKSRILKFEDVVEFKLITILLREFYLGNTTIFNQ